MSNHLCLQEWVRDDTWYVIQILIENNAFKNLQHISFVQNRKIKVKSPYYFIWHLRSSSKCIAEWQHWKPAKRHKFQWSYTHLNPIAHSYKSSYDNNCIETLKVLAHCDMHLRAIIGHAYPIYMWLVGGHLSVHWRYCEVSQRYN